MRRAHMGNEPPSYQPTAQMLEAENQNMEDQLSSKVKALKSLTIDMGNEVREQNRFLSEMDEDFDKSKGILQSTMGRLKDITSKGGPRLWCYMFLFTVFIFMLCWIIIKIR